MEWLAIKFRSGEMLCMSREEREVSIDKLRKEGKEINSVVEKKFKNKNDCVAYCDRINKVNTVINNL